MNYNITSADQIIDSYSIKRKIQVLRIYVNDFNAAANYVEDASEICTPEAFMAGETVLNEILINLAEDMHQRTQYFSDYLDELNAATDMVYNAQMQSYNEYKRQQEEIRRRREEQEKAARREYEQQQAAKKATGTNSN